MGHASVAVKELFLPGIGLDSLMFGEDGQAAAAVEIRTVTVRLTAASGDL